ncbi:hypothetical protein DIPPA_16868 [Diplonema papillatum]|nr:hypothetical protein DIPPA_16868 [Diplonema papillatum]
MAHVKNVANRRETALAQSAVRKEARRGEVQELMRRDLARSRAEVDSASTEASQQRAREEHAANAHHWEKYAHESRDELCGTSEELAALCGVRTLQAVRDADARNRAAGAASAHTVSKLYDSTRRVRLASLRRRRKVEVIDTEPADPGPAGRTPRSEADVARRNSEAARVLRDWGAGSPPPPRSMRKPERTGPACPSAPALRKLEQELYLCLRGTEDRCRPNFDSDPARLRARAAALSNLGRLHYNHTGRYKDAVTAFEGCLTLEELVGGRAEGETLLNYAACLLRTKGPSAALIAAVAAFKQSEAQVKGQMQSVGSVATSTLQVYLVALKTLAAVKEAHGTDDFMVSALEDIANASSLATAVLPHGHSLTALINEELNRLSRETALLRTGASGGIKKLRNERWAAQQRALTPV